MDPASSFDDIKHRINDAVDRAGIAPELKKQVAALVQSVIARLDLVSREEFDAQSKVLAHTRERLEALEQEVEQLLAQLPDEDHTPPTEKPKSD